MTALRLAVAAAVVGASFAVAAPASAACAQQGDPDVVAVDACFILRPSYLRCLVYVAGTEHDCKDLIPE